MDHLSCIAVCFILLSTRVSSSSSQFILVITLTSSFIYQEPTQLNQLQDKGLTDAFLDALFNDKVYNYCEFLFIIIIIIIINY
jgi:hypothetical protein